MTDKAGVLNGGGVAAVGGARDSQPADVMDSWKRVAQINMKALELVSQSVIEWAKKDLSLEWMGWGRGMGDTPNEYNSQVVIENPPPKNKA